MKRPSLTICGVMSGSSLDGLDMAVCSFDQDNNGSLNWAIEHSKAAKFPETLVQDLLKSYTSSAAFIYGVEQRFSKFCGEALKEFVDGKSVDYIAFHGHTIFHEPEKGYTVQIGNAHQIAQNTGVPVIAQFRNKDVALGGQGAPIAPIVEKYLLPNHNGFLNLGGIANISKHSSDEILAYDITACNQALNHLSSKLGLEYDDNGRIAASGMVDNDLLSSLKQLEFLKQKAPKSLSNTWVQDEFLTLLDQSKAEIKDKMRTSIAHIATEIGRECEDMISGGTIMASGGGVHNSFMMDEIKKEMAKNGIELSKPSDLISEYKEALLMALMGYLRINEVPNCMASVTGATRDSCNGIIFNPSF